MMSEIMNTYVLDIHKELKARIKAGIYVEVRNYGLYVKIINDDNVWECCFSDFDKLISRGLSKSVVCDKIVEAYKAEIMRRYFV